MAYMTDIMQHVLLRLTRRKRAGVAIPSVPYLTDADVHHMTVVALWRRGWVRVRPASRPRQQRGERYTVRITPMGERALSYALEQDYAEWRLALAEFRKRYRQSPPKARPTKQVQQAQGGAG